MITVIGASNVDIQGLAKAEFRPGDSIPGKVEVAAGGVGRNIAENAARFGLPVCFVTAFGSDFFSNKVISSFDGLDVDLSGARTLDNVGTSIYLCVLADDGNLVAAINEMAAADEITPELIERNRDAIAASDCVLIESNLREDTIGAVLSCAGGVPVIADCVSVAKCVRLKPHLGKLAALKPNRKEIEALTGICVKNEDDAKRAATALHDLGVESVFLSLGEGGLMLSERSGFRGIARPAEGVPVVNVSGAGDAMIAAIAWSLVARLDPSLKLRGAQAAASLTCASEKTVNPNITAEAVFGLAQTMPFRVS